MNMEQADDKGNCCAQCATSDIALDQIDLAMESQLSLCVAALFVLDNSERLRALESEPELLALRGIIGAIGERSKFVLEEIETTNIDVALSSAFGGAS